MIVRQRPLASLRFGDRDVVALDTGRKRSSRVGIEHTSAGDDKWLAGTGDQACGFCEFARIGRRAPPVPDALGEEALRIGEGLRLSILAQRERDPAARAALG